METARVPWRVIKATQSIHIIQENIKEIVEGTLEQVRGGKKIGKMWDEGEYCPGSFDLNSPKDRPTRG